MGSDDFVPIKEYVELRRMEKITQLTYGQLSTIEQALFFRGFIMACDMLLTIEQNLKTERKTSNEVQSY